MTTPIDLYVDYDRTRLLVKATGFYEVDGGWIKFWDDKYGYNIYAEKDFTYLYTKPDVTIVDRTLTKKYYPDSGLCRPYDIFYTGQARSLFVSGNRCG